MHESARTPDVRGLSRAVLCELETQIQKEQYETWFRGFRLVSLDQERFEFGVPSVFARDWLRKHFREQIEAAVFKLTGKVGTAIVLNLDQDRDGRATGREGAQASSASTYGSPLRIGVARATETTARAAETTIANVAGSAIAGPAGAEAAEPARTERFDAPGDVGPTGGVQGRRAPAAASEESRPTAGYPSASMNVQTQIPRGEESVLDDDKKAIYGELNRNYTFEQFVVGTCNRLSHAAALAVGDNPGRAYNPLFIHGNVGLGKTHLLQATCHAVRRKTPDARVLYKSCEDFTNDYIRSIRRGQLEEFREFHRSIDVLVIDDIQFLANKEKTQDEFFHTFNALYNDNRQIIISSDRSPLEIPTVEERLVSRFKWGLVAEMEAPEFETRVAIVKRKARVRQIELGDDVAYFIAERIDTNIRELEGAVLKVIGVSSITDREISVSLAEEALRGVVMPRNRQVSMNDVMGIVTEHFSLSARDLIGKVRTQTISLPRQIGMYLCRHHTEQSLEEIGRFFGNRDHTTVLYAVQKIKKRVKEDRLFRELVNSLSGRVG